MSESKSKQFLIAFDGSGYSHGILHELLHCGLPDDANVLVMSVSEVWLPISDQIARTIADRDLAEYFPKHRAQMDRNLEESKEIVRAAHEELQGYFPNWQITSESVFGSPARKIPSRALEVSADLIVVGERGLSSDGASGIGSVAQRILADSECSVRISRPRPDVFRPRPKVMIGFDGSRGSLAAVRAVAVRSWRSKPEIRLVIITDPLVLLKPGHVLQPIPGLSEQENEGEQKWGRLLSASALEELSDAGLSATVTTYSGNPRMILTREAKKWDADAIFLGATSFGSPRESSSIGCVALSIAARAPCSVEVVREFN